ncbi:hypothetical protein HDA40_006936 [Hamadaea flava]|uniref:YdeI/OmpD-associated family protein n=1 Tax=Hamadaea flava TaxID=1742688 RepID=A0ABV8M0M3_9ACTN|nr:YdeI/OmpD-associated family protein [Hamadaea flava]MCP2328429.1 hypothetical protein [Hamadaea flava]
MSQKSTTPIRFEAGLETVVTTTIVRMPGEASKLLPSRGQVAVNGFLNGHAFQSVIEPDGRRGHWIKVDDELQRAAGLSVGDAVDITVEPAQEWPEPEVPADFADALASAPQRIRLIWDDITPMARWEWVRWINATANPSTRQTRVEASLSKMDDGKRRPCCFDLSSCTDTTVSRSGKLHDTA